MRFRLCCLIALMCVVPAMSADGAVQMRKDSAAKKTTAAKKESTAKTSKASDKSSSASAKARSKKAAPTTAAREKAALKFAKQHHPELVGLLEHLKSRKQQKQQYSRAIRDLTTARERLEKMKERFPEERYNRELESWKQSSRIRLVLARLQMADPANVDSLRQQLQDLIQQQTDDRLARFVEEQSKLQARLKKLNQSIDSLQDGSFVADEVKRLERTVKNSREKTNAKQKSIASKRKPNKSKNANRKTVAEKPSAGQNKSEDQ